MRDKQREIRRSKQSEYIFQWLWIMRFQTEQNTAQLYSNILAIHQGNYGRKNLKICLKKGEDYFRGEYHNPKKKKKSSLKLEKVKTRIVLVKTGSVLDWITAVMKTDLLLKNDKLWNIYRRNV